MDEAENKEEGLRMLSSTAFDATHLIRAKTCMREATRNSKAHTSVDFAHVEHFAEAFLDSLIARPETTVEEAGLAFGAILGGLANLCATPDGAFAMMATIGGVSNALSTQALGQIMEREMSNHFRKNSNPKPN
jgi:hypothetical protein